MGATVDANGQYLLLAWAIVESENTESWTYFLTHLKEAIPEVLQCSIMSDRDKGLLRAEDCLGPRVTRLLYLQHLWRNFTKKYGLSLEGFFWHLSDAATIPEFQAQMALLREEKSPAADYLLGIDLAIWAAAYIPGGHASRKGQLTSNAVEVLNSVLRDTRELSLIDLLSDIWHRTMATRFERYEAACKIPPVQTFTPYAYSILQEQRSRALRNLPSFSDRSRALVVTLEGRVYTVDLVARTCTCLDYQKTNLPCRHAIACILHLGDRLDHHIPAEYSVGIWKDTYSRNLQPVSYSAPVSIIQPTSASTSSTTTSLPFSESQPPSTSSALPLPSHTIEPSNRLPPWLHLFLHNQPAPPLSSSSSLSLPPSPSPPQLLPSPSSSTTPNTPSTPLPSTYHSIPLTTFDNPTHPPTLPTPSIILQPPHTRPVIGRIKKKRAISGEASTASGRGQQLCSSCGLPGHNSRRCRLRTFH